MDIDIDERVITEIKKRRTTVGVSSVFAKEGDCHEICILVAKEGRYDDTIEIPFSCAPRLSEKLLQVYKEMLDHVNKVHVSDNEGDG